MRRLRERLTVLRDDQSGLSLAEILIAMMLTYVKPLFGGFTGLIY